MASIAGLDRHPAPARTPVADGDRKAVAWREPAHHCGDRHRGRPGPWRLQGLVKRLMYGDRDDPYAATSRLALRLSESVTPAALLPTVAETVARALRLPYVAVGVCSRGRLTPTRCPGPR